MSSFPKFTIKEMLESGVHYGHKSMLWNPKMAQYIYCERNGVHIINLQKSAALLHSALKVVYQTIRANPKAKILFVGTKPQAAGILKEHAESCGQYFVNHRWLGGMLTNWNTVSKSIKKLGECEQLLADAESGESTKYNKKELLEIDRKREKLDCSLGGIREMRNKPDLILVIDTNKEKIAIQEAHKLNIPVMAVIDTNSKLDHIDYPIPGNDDSSKSIDFYCRLMSAAVLAALEDALVETGVDPVEAKDKVRTAIAKDKEKAAKTRTQSSIKVEEEKKPTKKSAPKKEEKVAAKQSSEEVSAEAPKKSATKKTTTKSTEKKEDAPKKATTKKEEPKVEVKKAVAKEETK